MLTTMKKSVLTISAIIAASAVMAQGADDALRFSQTYQQGTARSAAMGGAFGALGGDISILATNPAGMSIYKDGEFTFTPVFGNVNTNTTLNKFEQEDSKFAFKLGNIGFVTSHHNGNESGFSGFAFGMSFNRLNDFSANNIVYGRNDNSSFLDYWAKRSNGANISQLSVFDEYPAYYSLLIDSVGPQQYKSIHQRAGARYGQYQNLIQTVKGGINSWDFAFSGVYAEKFYFGASLGIQSVNYKIRETISELDDNDVADYRSWDLHGEQEDHGTGINLKAGIIYKPVNFLRFGAAIHTPTYYAISHKFYTQMTSELDTDTEPYECDPYKSDYEFRLLTPFKAIFSGALIVPNIGLLSVDYECVDYSKARFETSDEDNYTFTDENNDITKGYRATNNLRIGIEALAGQISVRGGYAIYGNPYKWTSDNIQRQVISGGLGFRGENMFFDITGTYHLYNTKAIFYGDPLRTSFEDVTQFYDIDRRQLYVMATVGFKF